MGQLGNVPPDVPALAGHDGMLVAARGDHPADRPRAERSVAGQRITSIWFVVSGSIGT
jgi:hypothetical protein